MPLLISDALRMQCVLTRSIFNFVTPGFATPYGETRELMGNQKRIRLRPLREIVRARTLTAAYQECARSRELDRRLARPRDPT